MRKKDLRIRLAAAGLAGVMAFSLAGCGKKPGETAAPAQTTAAEAEKESGAEAKPSEAAPESEADNAAKTEDDAAKYIQIPKMDKKDFPSMDGSTATLPLGRMIYKMATGASDTEAENEILYTKTTNSYMRLMDGEAEIIISYEAGEAAKERPEYDDLDIQPIGLDALIFLCNVDNPVKSLTTKQIQDIYTGKIHNWSEVGAKNFDKEIIAFQRPDNSGSQTLMKNLMMKGLEMAYAPAEYRPGEMGDLVSAVADYNNKANALGYSVYYYANNMFMIPGLRFMGVDDVEPTNDTIRSGDYKYVNPFYVAVRKDCDKNSEAYKLFKWLTDDDGQALINALGYVAYSDIEKEIPEEYKVKYAEVDSGARRLVFDGKDYNGNAGIVVFGKDLHPESFYSDVRINNSFVLSYGDVIIASAPKDAGVPTSQDEMYSYYDGSQSYGLYNIKTGKWVVEPDYNAYSVPWVVDDRDLENLTFVFENNNWETDEHTIACFDMQGNQLKSDGLTEDDIMYDIANYDDYKNKYYVSDYENRDDGTYVNTFRAGKDGEFVSDTRDEEREGRLYLHGKDVKLCKDSIILPYMGFISEEDKYPMGWTYIHSYDMDENYDCTGQIDYLITEDSDIIYTITNMETYLQMAAKDYCITKEYDRYVIRNYDGEMIYNWRYSTYDADYDWRYDN